jgi:hypothetical protein
MNGERHTVHGASVRRCVGQRWAGAPVGRSAALLALSVLAAACASAPAREAEMAPQVGPGGSGSASASVSLAGAWRYDERATGRSVSERGGMPMEGPRGGFGGQPGGMGGGYGGRGGYPQGGSASRAARDSMQVRDSLARDSVRAEFGRLVIEQTDSALTFTQGRSAPLTVYTDWRETRIAGRYGPGDVTFVTGQWKGGRFEVRRALPSRTVVVESYELSRDGRQLVVTTRIAEKSDERGELLPREGRRVYTRAPATSQ